MTADLVYCPAHASRMVGLISLQLDQRCFKTLASLAAEQLSQRTRVRFVGVVDEAVRARTIVSSSKPSIRGGLSMQVMILEQ